MRDHYITIQQNTPTSDHGNLTDSWATFAQLWASKEPLSGREWFAAQQTQSEVQWRWILREYRTDVTSAMRILDGTDVYQIVAAMPDERKRRTVLMCKAVN